LNDVAATLAAVGPAVRAAVAANAASVARVARAELPAACSGPDDRAELPAGLCCGSAGRVEAAAVCPDFVVRVEPAGLCCGSAGRVEAARVAEPAVRSASGAVGLDSARDDPVPFVAGPCSALASCPASPELSQRY
jgi:hypothetical protein